MNFAQGKLSVYSPSSNTSFPQDNPINSKQRKFCFRRNPMSTSKVHSSTLAIHSHHQPRSPSRKKIGVPSHATSRKLARLKLLVKVHPHSPRNLQHFNVRPRQLTVETALKVKRPIRRHTSAGLPSVSFCLPPLLDPEATTKRLPRFHLDPLPKTPTIYNGVG